MYSIVFLVREFAEDVVLTPEQIEKSFALTDLFGKKGWNVAKSEFSGLGMYKSFFLFFSCSERNIRASWRNRFVLWVPQRKDPVFSVSGDSEG